MGDVAPLRQQLDQLQEQIGLALQDDEEVKSRLESALLTLELKLPSKPSLFDGCERQITASRAMAVLLKAPAPSVGDLLDCVRAGANIYDVSSTAERKRSTLHTLVALGLTRVVEVVVNREEELDLTGKDYDNCTPLHLVCTVCPELEVRSMLKLFVERLEKPQLLTKLDWEQKNDDDEDFIGAAVRHRRLALVWPVVRDVPFFADKMPKSIELSSKLDPNDWSQLDQEDQDCFCTFEDRLVADLESGNATDKLLDISSETDYNPPLNLARRCVKEGADVTAKKGTWLFPLLTYVVKTKNEEFLKVLLESPNAIDFTSTRCKEKINPFHAITMSTCTRDKVRKVLELLLDRVAAHPEDVVDWDQKCGKKKDVVARMAEEGHLSTFWEAVKAMEIAHFVKRDGRIRVTQPVKASDWDRISAEDKQRFELLKDVEEEGSSSSSSDADDESN